MNPGTAVQQVADVTGWQIASTIATGCAAVVALGVAVMNTLNRLADKRAAKSAELARSLTQARLVITPNGTPSFSPVENWPNIPDAVALVEFSFTNHGDRPVVDVYAELWVPGQDGPATAYAEVVRAGESRKLPMVFTQTYGSIGGWRIRWTDADGQQWYRDGYPQPEPKRFTPEMLNYNPW
jgi:hypothetical protein